MANLSPKYSVYFLRMFTIVRLMTQSWHGGSAHRKSHIRSYFIKNSCHKCVKSNRHCKAKINHITKVEDSRNHIYWVRCVTDHALKYEQLAIFTRIKKLWKQLLSLIFICPFLFKTVIAVCQIASFPSNILYVSARSDLCF